jgi:hypothetical protein
VRNEDGYNISSIYNFGLSSPLKARARCLSDDPISGMLRPSWQAQVAGGHNYMSFSTITLPSGLQNAYFTFARYYIYF